MHKFRLQLCRVPLVLVALVLSPLFAPAQSMTLTNGVQTYTALTNTTVTLSGRCELRLAAASNPMPGCTIHLNSPDAFLVLQSIRPSALVSAHLGQVRINGAVASADNNCRVVAYGDGAVVVPHAAAMQPLQAFAGPYFTGAATNFGKHVYYRGAGLGAWNAAIGSFRLKRGYAVTFAEQEDGAGASRNYVAADGDLDVAVLPAALQGKVRFIYVVPWRWTSKKGIAGNIESGLNLGWKYNWNLDQNSSRDLEYVPIRQNQYWPGLSQDWQARGSSHLLGYNEPDRPDQANMSIATALGAWPDLLATGLRLGSPATSDGGRSSWLYPFLTQADAAGLRVDFVPVHYYWCFNPTDPAGAANQFYNFLKATYDEVKRPLWITEWNNGANWTGCGDPTSTQQRDCIAAMIQMLEDTPWVERYALYNWVEDSRRVKWDDGSLTAAGVAYRDQPSRIAYLQTPQDNGTRSFGQYAFDGHTLDGSGYGNSGVTTGSPGFTNGVRGQALVFDGANTRVTLPPNVARNSAFTFAAWVNWQGGGDWQRIFDFGNSTTHNLFLTPRSSTGTLRFGIRNGGTTQVVETTALPQNAWRHVAITLSGANARLYVNGVLAASSTSIAATPASFSPRYNFLGRSQWPADPHFRGLLDEVLVTDYALSAAEVASLLTNAPPQFTDTLIVLNAALEGQPYTNNLAGRAADADAADTFSFNQTVGPAWLSVAADGTLSGTPAAGDRGTNYFTVRVANPGGYSGYAVAAIPVITTSGVWIADASAGWSQTIRWSGGQIASGAGGTADFSTINITSDRTVVLDSPRTLGALRFGDTSGAQTWTLAGSTVNALTLDTGSTAQPALIVTNLARLAVRVAGTNGFVKSGPGTLLLTQSNTLSGVLNLDRGVDGNNHDGITRLAHPGAAQNLAAINLRNTSVSTAGGATLQLDGSLGNIFLPQPMTVTCRNNTTTPMIQNLAGSNTLAGFIGLLTGGNMFNLQSDTGLLVLAGTNQYVGSLTAGRTYNFWGAGDHLLTGPIRSATNGAPIGITKSGSGTLTLAAVNTYTNTTAVNAGTLLVNGALPASPVTVASGATLGGAGIVSLPVTLASGATLAPGAPFGTLWLNASLALPAGTTTRLALSRAPLTNGQLRVDGVFTRGGALVVTSLGGVLEAGDNFRLFITPNATGSFASVSLPPPGPGLGWDTRHLLTEGTVWVVRTTPPALELTVAGEGGLTLRALNGTPGWPCYLRAADDFTLPLAQWPRVATNTFNAAGEILVSLPPLPDIPARFYTLEVP